MHTMIVQNIKGEEFSWCLLQLEDGRIQATWREPISGAVGCTIPEPASEHPDMEHFGYTAFCMRTEQIRTIDGREYHLVREGAAKGTFVTWLDDESGLVSKAKIQSKWGLPALVSDEEVLNAVNTPELWVE